MGKNPNQPIQLLKSKVFSSFPYLEAHNLYSLNKDDQPDWITALQAKSQGSKKKIELEERRRELKNRITRVRNETFTIETVEKANKKRTLGKKDQDNDEEYLIGDYESDEENGATTTVNKSDANSNLSKEVQALLAK